MSDGGNAFDAVTRFLDVMRQAGDGTAQTGSTTSDVGDVLIGQRENVTVLQQWMQDVQDQLKPPSGGKTYDGDPGADTTSGWGAPWTLFGATTAVYLNQKAYFWQDSGSSLRTAIGIFNAGQTATDVQIVSIILNTLMESPPWNSSNDKASNWAIGRASIDGENFVYAKLFYNRLTLGCRVAGVDTDWTTATVKPAAGARLELQCGTSDEARQFLVRLNGAEVINYTESGTTSLLGSGYRYGGQALQSDARGSTESSPGSVYQWKLQDLNPPGIIGSGLYVCRFNTASVTIAKDGAYHSFGGFFDHVVYGSDDLAWDASTGGVTIGNPGHYVFDWNVQFDTVNVSGQTVQSALGQNASLAVGGPVCYSPIDAFAASLKLYCNAGDVMYPLVAAIGEAQNIVGGATGTFSWFQCTKLNP